MRDDGPRATDGTQPTDSPSAFPDPLAGLVSGQQQESKARDHETAERRDRGRYAPDPERVRRLLDGVLDPNSAGEDPSARDAGNESGESGDDSGGDSSADSGGEKASGGENAATESDAGSSDGAPVTPVERPDGEQRPGMLPQRRGTWPARRRLTRQAWRPRQRASSAARPAADADGSRKPGRGSAGVAIAIALLLLFVFVAIEFVVSLLNTLSGIGG